MPIRHPIPRFLFALALALAAHLAPPVRSEGATRINIVDVACTEAAFNTALRSVQNGGGGLIAFDCGNGGRTPVEITLSATKQITRPVTIDGGGFVTFKAGTFVQLFVVSGGQQLHLRDITLRDGTSLGSSGGAVYMHPGSGLSLQNTRVATSYAANGGAIYAAESGVGARSRITLTGAVFEGNVAANFGGAVYAANNDVSVISSTFTANQAINGSGGAIVGGLFLGPITVTASSFASNTAYSGGALAWSNGSMYVARSRFVQNAANGALGGAPRGDGGAIETNGPLVITGTTFLSNTVTRDGGALRIHGNTLSLAHSELRNNRAISGSGGVAMLSNGAAWITSTTMVTNTADGQGGAIHANHLLLSIAASTLITNASRADGGAIYVTGASALTVTGSTLAGNQARAFSGGAIAHRGDKGLAISGSVLRDNVADARGGALYANTGSAFSTVSVSGTRILSNTTRHEDGGGVSIPSERMTVFFTQTELAHNRAVAYIGGGMYSEGSLRMISSTIHHNAATAGAGVYYYGSDPALIRASEFSHNRGEGGQFTEGAGLYTGDADAEVIDSLFMSNTSTTRGGAIYSQGALTVTGSTLAGNSADQEGGALMQWGGRMHVVNSTFSANSAPRGGGVASRDAAQQSVFLHSTFAGNHASLGASVSVSAVAGSAQRVPVVFQNSVFSRGVFGQNCLMLVDGIASLGGNHSDDASCAAGLNHSADVNNAPAGLGPLAGNDGLRAGLDARVIPTHLPGAGSAVIDTAPCEFAARVDQRRVARPVDGDHDGSAGCDKGAVERAQPARRQAHLPAIRR